MCVKDQEITAKSEFINAIFFKKQKFSFICYSMISTEYVFNVKFL